METLAASIIAAGAAIAAAVITAIMSNRKLDKTLAVHDEASKGRTQDLAHGHSDLSRDHTGIEKTLQAGNATLVYLKDERLKEATRQELLKGQELKVEEVSVLLRATNQTIAELRSEVQDLKQENLILRGDNQMLRQSIQAMGRSSDHDWEPEL